MAGRTICSSGPSAVANPSTSPPTGISSRIPRNGHPTAASSTSPPRLAARRICSASRQPAGAVEQVTKGERRLNGLTIDRAFKTIAYTVGVHEAPPEVYTANIDGTNERKLSNVHARPASEIALQQGRAAPLAQLRRHHDRGLADVSLWLRRAQGPVSADRDEPWRAALRDRLQLRLQEAVLRGQRLLRLRHELPQFDRLRRRLQVGNVGRMGQEGRRRRRLGRRLRPQALPDRCEARRTHRPLVWRVHDQLADHAISGKVCRGHHGRRHHELDQRLRHRGYLSHEGNGVLRHAVGHRPRAIA